MIAPNSHGSKYKKKFDKIFSDLSKKYKLELIPFLLDGVAAKSEFNLSDGIHPVSYTHLTLPTKRIV